ncbi:MAG: hypothetical protein NTX50_02300 [Candidatus Sumerlaeota bacterium]|nr:hypothetical protein [Candidatus Sumerlaeota bacterium]
MKEYEPLSAENPLLDRERRRLAKKWSYKIFVGAVFLLAAAMLSVPFVGSWIYRAFDPSQSGATPQLTYSLQSQYDSATATTVSVVLWGNSSSPAGAIDASTYTLRQIPNVSKPALLMGAWGLNIAGRDAIQRFYYLELQGYDKSGKPLYRTLAAEVAWEGSREWQYVDASLPEKQRKDLAALLTDETSRALALAPAAWKTSGKYPSGNPGGSAPPAPRTLNISDPYDFRGIRVAPAQISPNPKLSADHINALLTSVMNTAFVVTNGAQPATGIMMWTNRSDKIMSMILTYIVTVAGGLLLWLYYLVIFPMRRTGELESRVISYTMPQLRMTLLTGRDVAEGLLYAPRRYWLWPACVFLPAMVVALAIVWGRWGVITRFDFMARPDSTGLGAFFSAAGAVADALKWPLAGWLSFALGARFCGNSMGRYASVIVLAFGYPIAMVIISMLVNMAIMIMPGVLFSATYHPSNSMPIITAILPLAESLFWLVITGVAAWMLSRGLGQRIAAFEPRGE